MSVFALFGFATSLQAQGQAQEQAQVPTQAQALERVVITGSGLKQQDGETALPVQVIRREEIDRTAISTSSRPSGRPIPR